MDAAITARLRSRIYSRSCFARIANASFTASWRMDSWLCGFVTLPAAPQVCSSKRIRLRHIWRRISCSGFTRGFRRELKVEIFSAESARCSFSRFIAAKRASETMPVQPRSEPAVVLPRYEDRPEVAMQLDMRGWRVEQALEELDSYLNDAVMSGMSSVRIVHGKGTGALRSAIRDQLTHHPLVKSFASAPPQEGGDGVTIVKLSA